MFAAAILSNAEDQCWKKTIITPSARDLGESRMCSFWLNRKPANERERNTKDKSEHKSTKNVEYEVLLCFLFPLVPLGFGSFPYLVMQPAPRLRMPRSCKYPMLGHIRPSPSRRCQCSNFAALTMDWAKLGSGTV